LSHHNRSHHHSPKVNSTHDVKKIFHDYMRENYFKDAEILTFDKVLANVKFESEIPYILIDLYLYLFGFYFLKDDIHSSTMASI